MSFIDSYLVQVGRHLPDAQRDDILSELRSSLEDQARDIAGDRAPGAAEEKAVLERLGHPLKVASGYTGPRYLIGPELFPSFVLTLQRVLTVVALVQIGILGVAYVTSGDTTSVVRLLTGMFDTLAWASVIVLTVFVTIEFSGDQLNWYDNWSPNSLKLQEVAQIRRGDLITNLVSEAFFLLWWNGILVWQYWIPGNADVLSITLGPAWAALFWPLNALFATWLILHAVVLLRGFWGRITLWLEIALGAVGLGAAGWLLLQSPLTVVSGALSVESAAITERVVIGIIVFVAAATVWDIWLAVKRLRETRSV